MLVSVIVPVYNAQDYLAECYASIINQTHKNIEIIFVDNNSTDDSAKVLAEIVRSNPDVIALHESKQGASAARNLGLSHAKGEFIQFLDADDLLRPDKIEHQVKMLKSELKGCDILIADYERINPDGEKRTVRAFSSDVWMGLLKSRLGCTCSNLWRAAPIKEISGWNESLKSSQEYDLIFRLLKKGRKFCFDISIKTTVRERAVGNISNANLPASWETFCQLRYNIIQHLLSEKIEVPRSYWQVLFDSIRILYKYNTRAALEYFKYLPEGFFPDKSEVTSRSYLLLYRLLGFKGAEKAKRLLKFA